MSSLVPKTVLEVICEWSQARPLWQRDALRRIVANGALTDDELSEVIQICKKEHGAPDIAIEAIALAKEHLPAAPPNGASVALTSLSNVRGVNKLASGQTLPLEAAGLTIIYGDNGAGKSG
jgi:hypothetical protein